MIFTPIILSIYLSNGTFRLLTLFLMTFMNISMTHTAFPGIFKRLRLRQKTVLTGSTDSFRWGPGGYGLPAQHLTECCAGHSRCELTWAGPRRLWCLSRLQIMLYLFVFRFVSFLINTLFFIINTVFFNLRNVWWSEYYTF